MRWTPATASLMIEIDTEHTRSHQVSGCILWYTSVHTVHVYAGRSRKVSYIYYFFNQIWRWWRFFRNSIIISFYAYNCNIFIKKIFD